MKKKFIGVYVFFFFFFLLPNQIVSNELLIFTPLKWDFGFSLNCSTKLTELWRSVSVFCCAHSLCFVLISRHTTV